MKRIFTLCLTLSLLLGCSLPALAAAGYSDVPSDSWAVSVISEATSSGLVEGMGGGVFGYGAQVKRGEFVTALCRMFGWEQVSPTPAEGGSMPFTDVFSDKWYYTYVMTGLANGCYDSGGAFRPEEAITREEMAVMLARALGYGPLAKTAEKQGYAPFTDVKTNKGYIAVCYDCGLIEGVGGGLFAPDATAKREEMTALLVRANGKLNGETQWLHGFYAFSSWSQRALAQDMDAVSAGWSRLELRSGAVYLNITAGNGNEWQVPESYESITEYLAAGGTPLHLDVYMDNSDGAAKAVLESADNRSAAVKAITAELTRTYDAIGKNPYSGVTIDFEGLRGATQKAGFTAFLNALNTELDKLGKSLYVTVQPVAEGGYFDGFDYRAIGEAADKVILMAHDYNATDLTGFVGSTYYKTTALTPLAAVYTSLRAVTDPATGVRDRSKLAIAVSFSSLAWSIDGSGLLTDASPVSPASETIAKRLAQPDTVTGWSEEYKNPYATYTTEDGQRIFLWYENARSVSEKLTLARLFGITGVSVWRLGNIPASAGYDVTAALRGE